MTYRQFSFKVKRQGQTSPKSNNPYGASYTQVTSISDGFAWTDRHTERRKDAHKSNTCFASTAGAQVNNFLAFNQKSTTNFAGDTVWTQLSETQRRHDLSQQMNNVNMFYMTSDTTHAKKTA